MALTHGIVGFATCLCLIIFYAGAAAFGPINDVGNAVLGLLTIPLARLLAANPGASSGARERGGSRLAFAVAVVGAGVAVAGTVLVLTGITGFYLAGLWSSFGFSLIGAWLVATHWHRSSAHRRAALAAGAVMMLGLIGVPGILMGLDDMDSAPDWTFVAGISWAGTYLLFPSWSLRLARQDRPERVF
ncbi:hypothetical protein GCM10009630_25710 [Kribbella jejuensis]|uniref:Uncharacterized protein n=1 Tax=Kribbella jejuensis TaxID=236068 RepID=A0A542DUT6_9ACTN|nr:hypothetical protein FB475_6547 [Kribbella jejuensis]